MKVRATQAGHYGGYYREPGDVFEISDKTTPKLDGDGKPQVNEQGKVVMSSAFSSKWMEKVPEAIPETPLAKARKVSPLEALKEKPKAPETLSEVTEII